MTAQAPALPRRRRPQRLPWTAWAALAPVVLVSLPVIYILLRTAQLGAGGAWAELFRPRNLELLANTLTLALGVTTVTVVIGLAVAWCVERSDLPGRRRSEERRVGSGSHARSRAQ